MEEVDAARLRLQCLMEASRIKQNLLKEFEEKDVISLAKEFEAFVFDRDNK